MAMIATGKTYTEAFSGGVSSGGSGNFSSSACVITSESGTHFSSSLISGTLPSGLIFKNLDKLVSEEFQLLKKLQLENKTNLSSNVFKLTSQACYSNQYISCHMARAFPPT